VIAAEIPEDSPELPSTLAGPPQVILDNPAPYWSFVNVPQARILGFEADLNLSLAPWLAPYANYTFSDSRNAQTGQLIPARMRDKLEGGVSLSFPHETEIHLYDQFVDRNPAVYTGFQDNPPVIVASAYSILNADFKTDWAANAKAFLSFKNILNEQYATLQGLLMPGRYFEMGTTVNF
jgi:outer membrane receptor protein involved in Fe transport